MSFAYNDILQIPERCILNKKLTKVFFSKHFKLSVAEKKVLANDIQNMEWMASLKSTNANIPAVVNSDYAFEEIQFFIVTLADNQLEKGFDKAIKLIQKFIPYQAVVIVEDAFHFVLNTCDKRINQADQTKRTIEHYYTTPILSKLFKNEWTSGFFTSIAFDQLDKTNLKTTYAGYIQTVVQLLAAAHTGSFKVRSKVRSEKDMKLLEELENMEFQLAQLKATLKKEIQLNGQVNLNVAIQNKKKEMEKIKLKLSKD